jgi:hypothetical protein
VINDGTNHTDGRQKREIDHDLGIHLSLHFGTL